MHSHVSSSRLVSLLAEPASAGTAPPAPDFAEGLGQWLGALDAVRLRAALQAIEGIATAAAPQAPRPDGGELTQAFLHLRTALAGAIDADAAAIAGRDPAGRNPAGHDPAAGRAQAAGHARPGDPARPADRPRPIDRPDPTGQAAAPGALDAHTPATAAALRIAPPPLDPALEYAPYRRRHLEQQRRMESRIGALRTRARQLLSGASPRLRQLAALDAALEEAFGEREQKLLSTLPALAERCFERRLEAHRQALQASRQPDRPDAWRQPGGWLEAFGEDWRRILLAELDLRLEPVAGLIEAFGSEVVQCQ